MRQAPDRSLEQVPVPFLRCWRDAADAGRMHEGTSLPNKLALATKIGNEESKSIQKQRLPSLPLPSRTEIWHPSINQIESCTDRCLEFERCSVAA